MWPQCSRCRQPFGVGERYVDVRAWTHVDTDGKLHGDRTDPPEYLHVWACGTVPA